MHSPKLVTGLALAVHFSVYWSFYSASAMETAVLARGILSVRPSVCPSVTFRCFVHMNEDTIVRFSASDRTIILVSG